MRTRGDALPAGVPPPPARGRDRELRAPAALASGPGGVAPFARSARARSSVASWVPGSRRPTGQASRLLPVQAPLLGSAPPARGAVTGPRRPPPPSDDVYYTLSDVNAPSVGVWRRGEPGPFPRAGREASRRSRDTGRDSFPQVPPPAVACVTAAAEPPGSCGLDPSPGPRRQWAADYNSRQAPRRPQELRARGPRRPQPVVAARQGGPAGGVEQQRGRGRAVPHTDAARQATGR